MRMLPYPRVMLLCSIMLVTACAAPLKLPSGEPGEKCRAQYAEIDARIDAGGVRDGLYHRVPDFPFMRSDRLMASFAGDIGDDKEKLYNWIQYLRENDNAAREVELINLGLNVGQRSDILLNLRACSSWLVDLEMEDGRWRQHLLDSAVPPDSYSSFRRAIGLHPLAKPLLRRRIEAEHAAALAEHALPLSALDSPGPLKLWRVKPTADPALVPRNFSTALHDRLGLVGFQLSNWTALAEENAPPLWIEQGGDFDLPGAAQLGESSPGVDTDRPSVYWWASFARFGGETLVQLNYAVWFSARPPMPGQQDLAGPLDGLIWRVTLDPDGRALAYESLQASGLGYQIFPVQVMERKALDPGTIELPLIPQAKVSAGEIAVRVQSGSHRVRRVVELSQAAGENREYRLRPFEELFTLPAPGGGTRSLFDARGLVPGSDRSGGWSLWSTGIPSPGAMRQIGHHPTARIGRAHFDDPFLLGQFLIPPFGQRTEALASNPRPDDRSTP